MMILMCFFDLTWLVPACALRIGFAEMQPEVKPPCIGLSFLLPRLVLNQVFFRYRASEQWTDNSKYDLGTRPKPWGSLRKRTGCKESNCQKSSMHQHLMQDWLRYGYGTRIPELNVKHAKTMRFCKCQIEEFNIRQNAKCKFKIGHIGPPGT